MSAIRGKVDTRYCTAHVRFGSKADIGLTIRITVCRQKLRKATNHKSITNPCGNRVGRN